MNNLQEKINSEVWKDIDGFEGCYQVSNFGRVKSLKRWQVKEDKILKLNKGTCGYYVLSIEKRKEKKKLTVRVHSLVARYFLQPKPSNKHEIDHIDKNKTNNHYTNLRWLLVSENRATYARRKLNEKQVRVIKWLKIINPNRSNKEIGKFFKVSEFAISDLLNGRTWKHIKI